MVTATREDSESPCNGHLINRFQIWDRTARTGGSNKQVTDDGGERSILINSSKITYVEPLYGRYMKTRMRIYNCCSSHRGQHQSVVSMVFAFTRAVRREKTWSAHKCSFKISVCNYFIGPYTSFQIQTSPGKM